jgi:hypothetical protein
MKMYRASVVIAVVSAVLSAPGLYAQQQVEWDAGTLYATRAQLEAELAKFEDASKSGVYSPAVRSIARDEADLIRERLVDGDFAAGDQITLQVTGQTGLSATFTVQAGRLLILPDLGPFELTGLLRSELEDSLRAFVSKFIRNPQVYAQTTIRLQLFGAVGNAGFQDVLATARLTDVLGNPSGSADLDRMKIKRGDDEIWNGDALKQAIIEGRTIDQLSLRNGDTIEVPEVKTRNIGEIIRSVYFLIPVSIAIMRLF